MVTSSVRVRVSSGIMTDRSKSKDVLSLHASVLDHSIDFVELVYDKAPAEYRALVDSRKYDLLLEQTNTFNYGKLFVYAEYRVFRTEFLHRFPEAGNSACINAFSGLFLKNDISITNLLQFIEGTDERAILLYGPLGD